MPAEEKQSLRMRAAKLAAAAGRLKRQSGIIDGAFFLAFLSDLARIRDPEAVAGVLPPGAAFILRDYNAPDREALAKRLKSVCAARGVLFLVGADSALASAVGADGVHWPSWVKTWERLPDQSVVSASCHNAAELDAAASKGADIAFLSPVFPSPSHSGAGALGVENFNRMAAKSAIPILALGGVNEDNAGLLAGPNVAGLGAIGAFLAPPSASSN